jgi:broad specificity phosphatase PhoE
MSKKIFLIRHAESEANVGIPQKHIHNIVITENGRQQASDLAESLERPDRIIVSKFIRTIETAEPTMNKFPDSEVHLWLETHEFEPLAGIKEMPLEDQRAQNDEYWLSSDPHYKMSEEIESFKEFTDRMMTLRNKISNLPEGLHYIFTHGYVVRMFMLMMSNPDMFSDQNILDYNNIMSEFIEFNKNFKSKNTGVYDISSLL